MSPELIQACLAKGVRLDVERCMRMPNGYYRVEGSRGARRACSIRGSEAHAVAGLLRQFDELDGGSSKLAPHPRWPVTGCECGG